MIMSNRRNFLKKSTIGLAGATILPSYFGKGGVAASDRLNVAVIGVGGRGRRLIPLLDENPLSNLVAFADVDHERASETFKQYPDIPRYYDFRKMLDELEKQIDAVVIVTPDHTHHYIAKWCMNMGKHVFIEKPLAHSISEVRDLMHLEKKTGLACQMGNQGHSGAGNFLVNEWIKMGLLGDVEEVTAWTTHPEMSYSDTEHPLGEPVPETLKWDLWLGPAGFRPYSSRYLPEVWRGWYDFGTGALGDMACHLLDAAFLALDLDCPKRIEVESSEQRKLSFAENAKVNIVFPSAQTGKDVIVRWYHGPDYTPPRPKQLEIWEGMGGLHGGTILHGNKNQLMLESHAARPRFFPSRAQRDLQPQIKASLEMLPDSIPATHTDSHYGLATGYHINNWLLACHGDVACNSNFDLSGRLTESVLFAKIALYLGCNLDIDPVKRTIIGNETASKLMDPAPRQGWEI